MSLSRPLCASIALIAGAVGACVIADPPADLPTLPAEAPRIVRGSVVPSPDAILTQWPDKFVVPVQLADARSTVLFTTFVDFNPASDTGFKQLETSSFDLTTTQSSTRLLEFSIDEPSDTTCHKIEMVVALQFAGTTDARGLHTPGSSGGDSVTWFYSPGGDLAGCPVLDAGLQPDAAALLSGDGGAQ